MRTTVPSSGALHFSTRGEYGVRLMVELARHHGSGPVSLSEMAEHESLPRPYLEQLVVSLRAAGLVISTRGARGGYELSRDPVRIRMSEVITALEGPIVPMVCVSHEPALHASCDRALPAHGRNARRLPAADPRRPAARDQPSSGRGQP